MSFTTVETREQFAVRQNGKGWVLPIIAISPTAIDDNIAYLKNNGTQPIEVLLVEGYAATAVGVVRVVTCTGVAAGGTAVTPVALNTDSNKAPDVTFETGVDITGLTEVGVVTDLSMIVLSTKYEERLTPSLILGPNKAILLSASVATMVVTGRMVIIEQPEPVGC